MKTRTSYVVFHGAKASEITFDDAALRAVTTLRQARREAAAALLDHDQRCDIFRCVETLEVTVVT